MGVPVIRVVIFWGLHWDLVFMETATCLQELTSEQAIETP